MAILKDCVLRSHEEASYKSFIWQAETAQLHQNTEMYVCPCVFLAVVQLYFNSRVTVLLYTLPEEFFSV